jgi:hypothetical protein
LYDFVTDDEDQPIHLSGSMVAAFFQLYFDM